MRKTNCVVLALVLSCAAMVAAQDSFLAGLKQVLPVASTVPNNGDVNPYGIFQVPVSSGDLVKGHFLISNFNNSHNLQGTGTTIMDVAPNGKVTLFAQIDAGALPGACPGG